VSSPKSADFRAAYVRMKDFVLRFHRAGGLIAAGSDCLPSCDNGVHEELDLLVSAGLSPTAALRAATLDAARALGREGEVGALAPGLLADLLLLDANPLDDVRATRRIAAVITGGRHLDRAALQRLVQPAPDTVSFRVSTGTRLSFDLAPDGVHAATGAAARILGADAEIGTIAPGMRADLLLLDGDPTKDIRNTQKIALVLIGGHVAGGGAGDLNISDGRRRQ
jgi:imidazolonepropionase-like amidohydrolase